jgi:hypothetical protein
VVSREAKRIASRSMIRMQTRMAKGCEQRYVMPMLTGMKPSIGITTDRPDAVCMASRNTNRFDMHNCSRIGVLIKERAVRRPSSCVDSRMHMQAGSRIGYYVIKRIYKRIGTSISMTMRKRGDMRLAKRIDTRVALRIGMPMDERLGNRVSKGCYKRVSIGSVSWTGSRVSSYYDRYDSARRDSARRPAEGRQR